MTYETMGNVQRELDMMVRPMLVPEQRKVSYQPDRVYAKAKGDSRVIQYFVKQAYDLPPATPEANQMAQDALSTLERRLGSTDPVKKIPRETISSLIKETTGLYRIEPLEVI